MENRQNFPIVPFFYFFCLLGFVFIQTEAAVKKYQFDVGIWH